MKTAPQERQTKLSELEKKVEDTAARLADKEKELQKANDELNGVLEKEKLLGGQGLDAVAPLTAPDRTAGPRDLQDPVKAKAGLEKRDRKLKAAQEEFATELSNVARKATEEIKPQAILECPNRPAVTAD